MSSYKYVIRWLCLWSTGLHTRGFSFDRPLALRARVLSKLATRVQPVDHAPPSYNIYIAVVESFLVESGRIEHLSHMRMCESINHPEEVVHDQ